MKYSKNLLLMLCVAAFIGCDKDDFRNNSLVKTESDSLVCHIWLENKEGERTNEFDKGESITIMTSIQNLKSDSIWVPAVNYFHKEASIYRKRNDSFVGYPGYGFSELPWGWMPIAPLVNRPQKSESFFDGQTEEGKTLRRGKYYLKINYPLAELNN